MKFSKYFFLLSTILIGVAHSQPSEEQKQRWIQNLASVEFDSVYDALGYILQNKIVDAIPALEANSYKHFDILLKTNFYLALAELHSPNASTLIKNFMDSVTYYILLENKKGEGYASHQLADSVRLRLECTRYLFYTGDYSTAHFVIEDLQSLKPKTDPWMWIQVFINVPQYASIVKPKVMEYLNDSTQGSSRAAQLHDIREKYGAAFFPDMLDLTRNSPDPIMREHILFKLVEMGYQNSLELLKERFLHDSYSTMKREIAETLLTKYGSINEYAFLKNNISVVSRPIIVEMIQNMLDEFIPSKPSANLKVENLLDSLVISVKTVQTQNWLGSASFVKELTNRLDNAKKHLAKHSEGKNDSLNCAKEVYEFQKKVDEVYKETQEKEKKYEHKNEKFVTREGWKFLYYNAQYILDRLPSIKKEKE